MAKAKKLPPKPKPKGVQVMLSHMFHDGELFIKYTFKRRAREMFSLDDAESERVFNEALSAGLIQQARVVYPDIQSYCTGPEAGTIQAMPIEKIAKK